MPPVVLTLLQALFLLLLYVFVGRAVRTIARDLSPAGTTAVRQRTVRPAVPRRRQESRKEPRELVVHLPGVAPRVIPLDEQPEGTGVTFGRAPDMTVPLEDPYASDRHARVYRTEEGWVLADLGSTNGTYRNKEKVSAPVRLAAGDQFAIGKTVVEVRR